MLSAHLALAALTVGPSNEAAVETLLLAEGAPLSAEVKEVAAEVLEDAPSSGVEVTSAPLDPVEAAPVDPPVTAQSAAEVPVPALENAATAPPAKSKGFSDPLEPINRVFYAVSQPIDRIIIRPLALTYQAIVPKPLRGGARNVITNIGEPIVMLNDLLQLRPKRALKSLGRLLINSTIGVFGLFDIAKRKPFNLAHHSNSFGSTLGYYGVGPVMYIYLPLLGPNTLRDYGAGFADGYFAGRNLNQIVNYNKRGRYFGKTDLGQWGTAITVVSGLDQRAESDQELKALTEDSVDPYAALRSSFMQNRAGDIAALRAKDGETPATDALDDPLLDPDASTPSPPQSSSSPVSPVLHQGPEEQDSASQDIAQPQDQPESQGLSGAETKNQTSSYQPGLLRHQTGGYEEENRAARVSCTFQRDRLVEAQLETQRLRRHPQLDAAHDPREEMEADGQWRAAALLPHLGRDLVPFLADAGDKIAVRAVPVPQQPAERDQPYRSDGPPQAILGQLPRKRPALPQDPGSQSDIWQLRGSFRDLIQRAGADRRMSLAAS
jgi:phospholipid-binding lipoprotein MlaA